LLKLLTYSEESFITITTTSSKSDDGSLASKYEWKVQKISSDYTHRILRLLPSRSPLKETLPPLMSSFF